MSPTLAVFYGSPYSIVTNALTGHRPSDLMLKLVLKKLPVRWDEQNTLL
jgi:hypothetical protein